MEMEEGTISFNGMLCAIIKLNICLLSDAQPSLQDTTCPHVTMFRMMRGAPSSPERRDMVISKPSRVARSIVRSSEQRWINIVNQNICEQSQFNYAPHERLVVVVSHDLDFE